MYCTHCGKELSDLADVCVGCGRPVQKPHRDTNSVGWWWLGFFFPLIGFILWLVWSSDAPRNSRRAGFGALTGVIVSIVLVLVIYISVFALAFMLTDSLITHAMVI